MRQRQELINKLKTINPLKEDGTPKNTGNCQWCAIEGARVLLEGVDPREIPSYSASAVDPIESLVHPKHNSAYIKSKDSSELFDKIKELKTGELMLVSLESEDLDHAYIIYQDEEGAYLIDPDRQIFAKVDKPEDFHQKVTGWEKVESINYLNGDINSDFRNKVKVDVCVLNKQDVVNDPLPEYGTEPSSSYRL